MECFYMKSVKYLDSGFFFLLYIFTYKSNSTVHELAEWVMRQQCLLCVIIYYIKQIGRVVKKNGNQISYSKGHDSTNQIINLTWHGVEVGFMFVKPQWSVTIYINFLVHFCMTLHNVTMFGPFPLAVTKTKTQVKKLK